MQVAPCGGAIGRVAKSQCGGKPHTACGFHSFINLNLTGSFGSAQAPFDPETLKFIRTASNSIVASIAAAAQEALRNHEEAYRAQKVEEVTAKIDLTILSPAQGVEHLATELQAKKKHRSDALTHWEGKRKSDEENFNKLKEEMQEAVKQAQNNLEQTTAWYTAQRLMRETQHAESLKAIDGTITTLESKLAEAKRKEAAAGDGSHVPPTRSEQIVAALTVGASEAKKSKQPIRWTWMRRFPLF